jgi:curli biogenesis system outer membrane secretion channel CsgG
MNKFYVVSPLLVAATLLLCGNVEGAEGPKVLADGIASLATDIVAKVAKEQKRRVAVVPFRQLDGSTIPLDSYLSEELLTAFFSAGKFAVVERSLLDKLLGEIKLGNTGIIDPSTAQRIGKMAGADAIVTGTTTLLKSSVAVNCRLIDTQTGLVFSAAQVRIVVDDDVRTLLGSGAPPSATSPTGTEGMPAPVKPTKPRPAQVPREPMFATSEYRLVVESLHRAGIETRVVLQLENLSQQSLDFSASDWYLVDESGNRWESYRRAGGFYGPVASEQVFYQRLHILPGTKQRGTLIFRSESSNGGNRFTLVGTESQPGPGREIVIHDLASN